MPATNVKTRWVDGNLYFYDKSDNAIFYIDGTNRKMLFSSGAGLSLPDGLRTGIIQLPLLGFRKITAGDFGAIAVASGNGGTLANDTTPILQRINGATDPKARISWVANDIVPIQQDFAYPADLNDAASIGVHLLVYKSANVNTGAVLGVGFFEGIGDTDAGGNTVAITETVATMKQVTIAAGDVGAYPKGATVVITPGAHANDTIYLLAAWVSYTRLST